MASKTERREFGQVSKLPSGKYRARYADPEGRRTESGDAVRHNAPWTFDTKLDAETWLADERRLISTGTWTSPKARLEAKRATDDGAVTFREFADKWLEGRQVKGRPIRPRTREHYRKMLDNHILPTFGDKPIKTITRAEVEHWHSLTCLHQPTLRRHCYGLLKTIMGTAARRRIIDYNPVDIEGASSGERVSKTEPATLDELETIVKHTPERYKLMVLLASWCALRFGEVTELRRRNIDLNNNLVKIRQAVVLVEGKRVVGPPKSAAGRRDVAIPPHLVAAVQEHLDQRTESAQSALLFPNRRGEHLSQSTMSGWFNPAREAAGRPDLRFHDLRHTGAVLAAQTGATLSELMSRLGHSTTEAAMAYQHTARGRDAQIASRMSELAKEAER